jgi:hypothetical protein
LRLPFSGTASAGAVPRPILLIGGLTSLYGFAVFVTTFRYPGAIGVNYLTPGTDYMVFHTAVRSALNGDLATLYDGDRFTSLLNALFHARLPSPLAFRPWIYPPVFLILLLPFAPLGFLASYWAFQAITGAALWASLRRAAATTRGGAILGFSALACPAASIVAVSGQCTFLVAALLAAGATWLTPRPVWSGVMFGLLCFKPQFFVMVPVVLLAARAWRALVVTVAMGLGLAAASAAVFGPTIWTGWLAETLQSGSGADPRWFLTGRIWGNSVYTCAFLLGAGTILASAAQWVAIALAAAIVWRSHRVSMPDDLRLAILLPAVLLAAPHSGGYDTQLLMISAGLVLARRGGRATGTDWIVGLLMWGAPLIGQPAMTLIGRFQPALPLIMLARVFYVNRALNNGVKISKLKRIASGA